MQEAKPTEPSSRPWLAHAELVGERVRLRPVGPADVVPCFELVHERREVTNWLIWDGPSEVGELAPWFLTWPLGDGERGRDYHLAIVDPADGAFCGTISLKLRDHPGDGELGYWVAVERQGRGLASEAVALVTWLGFEVLGLERVHAECFEGNAPSRRVLERARLVEVERGVRTIEKQGREVRLDLFALDRAGWERAGRPGQPVAHALRRGAASVR